MANNSRGCSNIESFLKSITPSVPAQQLPKSWCQDIKNHWHLVGKDRVEVFLLGDLWDQYYEWSAYGAGVPLRLQSGEVIVQYYVPYLSGIQIYTRKPLADSRNAGEDQNISSNDRECKKLASVDTTSEGLGSGNIGHLYLEFFENSSPYARTPLFNKIHELAEIYPSLVDFKSTELSPASWMSVAWYPIYHIPTKRNVKELSASFLTFHKLSSLVQDNTMENSVHDLITTGAGIKGMNLDEDCFRMSLRPFGLSTYKMRGTLWTPPQSGDWETIKTLYKAADKWLKQLEVKQHDFIYFTSHFM
ncbi:hypothetical protein Cni_G19507 [Canna indica]|uniref:Uncharacterized protein n=1 Tax=Canna indica TaxID=4628 RepID=A0AAQ3KPL9_9LILI|nr:hypothetical protein Cni_G19507 [Canna indica]